jgi:hypothetical protein
LLGVVAGLILGMLAAGKYTEGFIGAAVPVIFIGFGFTGWVRRSCS